MTVAGHMTADLREELRQFLQRLTTYRGKMVNGNLLHADAMQFAGRLSELTAVPTWQPIETAPKGRKILVAYRNELGNWRRVMAMYYLAETLEMEEGSFDWDTESGFAPAGWYEEFENGEHAYPISATLELWCELPALPAAPEPPHG